nr:MAG TPA: hypothetical protein [Caudoviricetes sp.]
MCRKPKKKDFVVGRSDLQVQQRSVQIETECRFEPLRI